MKRTKQYYQIVLLSITAILSMQACSGSRKAVKTQTYYQIGEKFDLEEQNDFHDAMKAKILGDYETAIQLFKKAIKLNADNDAAYYQLAKIYYHGGMLQDAVFNAENATKLKADNIWYLRLYAKILSGLSRYDDAIGVFKKITEMADSNLDDLFYLSYLYDQNKKPLKAIDILNNIEKEIGINEQLSVEKKKLYLKANQLDKAIGEIEKLADANPANIRYKVMLAQLFNANGLEEKALDVFKNILKQNENDPQANLALAEYYRRKGELENYSHYIEKVFSLSELSIDQKISYLFGHLNLQDKDPLFAAEEFKLGRILIRTHPDEAKAWAMYGDMLYQADSTELALANYKRSIQLDNSVYPVWQQTFFIYSDLQKFDSLLASTNRVLDIFPNQSSAYFFNGVALAQKKQYQASIKSMQQVIMLGNPNPLLISEAWSNMGDAYNELKEYANSDSCFDQSLKANPNNAYVLNNYAYYLSLRKERLDKALTMIKKAVSLIPDNSAFEDTYAWILFIQGNYSEAENWLTKAIKHGGNSSDIFDHYGDILYRLNKQDEALAYWQKALKKEPGNILIKTKIEKGLPDE